MDEKEFLSGWLSTAEKMNVGEPTLSAHAEAVFNLLLTVLERYELDFDLRYGGIKRDSEHDEDSLCASFESGGCSYMYQVWPRENETPLEMVERAMTRCVGNMLNEYELNKLIDHEWGESEKKIKEHFLKAKLALSATERVYGIIENGVSVLKRNGLMSKSLDILPKDKDDLIWVGDSSDGETIWIFKKSYPNDKLINLNLAPSSSDKEIWGKFLKIMGNIIWNDVEKSFDGQEALKAKKEQIVLGFSTGDKAKRRVGRKI